jgi:DHA2 family methylenomycin A resistance protein-like MFS transporter
VFFDQTAVIVALPAIGREFGARAADLQWTITAYLLALAVFMLVAGRIADHVGRRRTFLVGLVVFAVGSLLCAAAPRLPLLIAARFLQGAGGAVVQPAALEVTTRTVSDDQRGWAIGTLATGGTSFLVVGPLLAGVLMAANWRWIFVVSVPIAAVAVVLGGRVIGSSRETVRRPIGWPSVLLLLIGLGALVFGLVGGEQFGGTTVIPIIAGLVILACFVIRELRAAHPLLDIRLLRNPTLSTSLAALFAIQFAVFGVTVSLGLYLQHGLGLSALIAGAVIAIAGIGTPLLSLAAGRAADAGGPRRLVLGGLITAAAALVLLGLIAPAGGVLILLPGLLVFAAARPAVFTPAGMGPLIALDAERRAFVASLATEARQLGAVLGVAVITAAGISGYRVAFVQHEHSLVYGFRAAALIAAGVCTLAAVIVWRLMPRPTKP